MKITKDEWKKIGQTNGWDKIYTENGYDPIDPIDPIEYDDDYSPENDLGPDEVVGNQDGELSAGQGIGVEVDLESLFNDPINLEQDQKLTSLLNKYPNLEFSIYYEISIDAGEMENNYPRQVKDVNLFPHINQEMEDEDKEFLFNLIKDSISIKKQIATRYGDEDYIE